MFLSQLNLDRMNRHAMRLVADVYSLHQGVMSGFMEYPGNFRVLFRVEPEVRDRILRVLVQSPVRPSWEKFGGDCRGFLEARVKEFHPALPAGGLFQFRLRANPTVTRNGKRLGLVRDDVLQDWLRRKEEKTGIRFRSVVAVDEGYLSGTKRTEASQFKVNIKTVRFEGVLQVADPELVRGTICSGIGSGKAFGCGLLSLARF